MFIHKPIWRLINRSYDPRMGLRTVYRGSTAVTMGVNKLNQNECINGHALLEQFYYTFLFSD